MNSTVASRAESARVLPSAIAIGAVIGLVIGGGYLGVSRIAPDNGPAPAAMFVPPLSGPRADPPPASSAAPPARSDEAKSATVRVSSRSELACLADAVYYEARGEVPQGQAAVAQVVMNRVHGRGFPNTVCGVVFQRSAAGCQFSFACNGAMREPIERAAWLRATQIAGRALGGFVMREVGGATHFQAASAALTGGVLQVARIGAHVFYRFTGHASSSVDSRLAEAASGGLAPASGELTAAKTSFAEPSGAAPVGADAAPDPQTGGDQAAVRPAA